MSIDRIKKLYEERVTRTGSGCWGWKGSTDKNGYGTVGTKVTGLTLAHRISWRIHKGPIPRGLHVLHQCDNPPCTNPDCLFLGTNLDNVNDRNAKDRQSRGEDRPQAKLTDALVLEMRQRYSDFPRPSTRQMAKDYGVSPALVSYVVSNKIWRHLL